MSPLGGFIDLDLLEYLYGGLENLEHKYDYVIYNYASGI